MNESKNKYKNYIIGKIISIQKEKYAVVAGLCRYDEVFETCTTLKHDLVQKIKVV